MNFYHWTTQCSIPLIKSKTPQGIEPRPNKWECHHRSLLLFCCCCKGKSKTWRNKRIVPPGKENPFTMAATLSRHGGTFRDTRLQLEDRTTGFPPRPTPALPKTLHWQLIPCFLPYYWHETTIPGDTQSCIALEILQVSRDTQGQRRLSCLLCSCKRRKRNNLCALPPPPRPVLQEHVFTKWSSVTTNVVKCLLRLFILGDAQFFLHRK